MGSSIVDYGTCGDYLTWSLDSSGKLTISGTGAMTDYPDRKSVPWNNYRINNRKKIITSAEIHPGVTSIGSFAFVYCDILTHVNIPGGVTSIGENAFFFCARLESVQIPDGLISIGKKAFVYCGALKSIHIPSSVNSIGEGAFNACESLTDLVVSSDNSVYSSENGALFNKDKTSLIAWPSARDSVSIPGSVVRIRKETFYACSELKSITFKGNAPTFDDKVFDDVTATVYYPAGNPTWTNVIRQNYGGTIQWKPSTPNPGTTARPQAKPTPKASSSAHAGTRPSVDNTCGENLTWNLDNNGKLTISGVGAMSDYFSLLRVPWSNDRSRIFFAEISPGVVNIGDYAFSGCDHLTSIVIPDSVLNVGGYAFSDCIGLTSITIPDRVAAIGDNAFRGCTGLRNIILPNCVARLGAFAFSGCVSLSTIMFEGNFPNIGERAFDGVNAAVHYPAGNLTWTDDARNNYGGAIQWITAAVGQAAEGTTIGARGDSRTVSSDSGGNRNNVFSNSALDVDKILSQIVSEYPEALDNRRRLNALLTDLLPQERLVRNTLLMAFDEGIVSELKTTIITDELTFHRYRKILIDNYGISDSLAEQAVRIWNNALIDFLDK